MTMVFGNFDVSDFWDNTEYAQRAYVDTPPADADVRAIETELGYTLPRSYIELMQ